MLTNYRLAVNMYRVSCYNLFLLETVSEVQAYHKVISILT